jgi:hypothetical protein
VKKKVKRNLNVRTLLPFDPGPWCPTLVGSGRMVKWRERVLEVTTLHITRENQLEVLHGMMVNQGQARVA